MTKYNGMRWVEGVQAFAGMVAQALALAMNRPAVVSDVAGRFPLKRVVDAYQAMESGSPGKILVLPNA